MRASLFDHLAAAHTTTVAAFAPSLVAVIAVAYNTAGEKIVIVCAGSLFGDTF